MSGNVTSDPPAEPALKVDTREELVYLLGQACEIEHGLMCEYLYAQFSLKRGPDEGLTDGPARPGAGLGNGADQRDQAGDAAPGAGHQHLDRHRRGAAFRAAQLPDLVPLVSAGVQIALVPFGERALRHFIYLERPEGMALDDAAGFAAAGTPSR